MPLPGLPEAMLWWSGCKPMKQSKSMTEAAAAAAAGADGKELELGNKHVPGLVGKTGRFVGDMGHVPAQSACTSLRKEELLMCFA